jgi:hypothetical protein
MPIGERARTPGWCAARTLNLRPGEPMSTEVDPNATAAAPEARVCPDCGSLAGAQPFCAQCGRKLSLIERLPARAEANTEGTPTKKRGNKRMIVGLIVVVLGVLYFTGSLDRMLVNVGSTSSPALRTASGRRCAVANSSRTARTSPTTISIRDQARRARARTSASRSAPRRTRPTPEQGSDQ